MEVGLGPNGGCSAKEKKFKYIELLKSSIFWRMTPYSPLKSTTFRKNMSHEYEDHFRSI
jgi:hypothetical protein